MAKAIKKPYLTKIVQGQKIADLVGEDKKYQLKLGKNVIDVVSKDDRLVRRKVVQYTGTESKVQQSLMDETDIKNILKKYGRTGLAPVMQDPGLYGDFSNVPSYQESLEIVAKAQEQFDLLPSETRKKFDNDPAKMLAFCTNPANLEEMRKLGLATTPDPAPEPISVKVIADPTPEA